MQLNIKSVIIGFAIILSTHTQAEVRVFTGEIPGLGRALAASIEGPIAPGDYQTLLNGTNQNPGPFAIKFSILNSKGGNIDEAIKIGRLIRQERFSTMVQPDGQCLSACVYILAAGIDKKVEGVVGIHRPYFPSATNEDAGTQIKLIKAASAAYFEEMNIPSTLAEEMYSIKPNEIKILSEAELKKYRLNQKDYVEAENITNELMQYIGWSREQYEAFTSDLNYHCTIHTGKMKEMRACIQRIAIKHNTPTELIEKFSN